MCAISYTPSATPAAMRSASICVLPEPAPASTRMLVSSSSRMVRRDRSSVVRESDMVREPPERGALGICPLGLRLRIYGAATGRDKIAKRAVVLVTGADEMSADNHFAQVIQH